MKVHARRFQEIPHPIVCTDLYLQMQVRQDTLRKWDSLLTAFEKAVSEGADLKVKREETLGRIVLYRENLNGF